MASRAFQPRDRRSDRGACARPAHLLAGRGRRSLLKALVPTLDNLDRALEARGAGDALHQGVELIRRELLAVLDSRGLAVLDPVGLPFDPEAHQALSYEPVEGVPDGTIVAVLRKGYRLGERLLRPALVRVAKGRDADGMDAVD